jgi:hypothetical protein
MPFNVNQFRTQLSGDGARPNLFEVRLNFPSYVTGRSTAQLKSTFMVKTAQLPGSTLGSVPVNYFGREVKVAGNRTFADWTVTVINDEDFIIRNAMESWVRGINDNVTNLRAALTTQQYAADDELFQYSKAGGSPIKTYKFVGMFPIDIAAIDLDWGSNDAIEEFSVTFQYQYWTAQDQSVARSGVVGGLFA